MLEIYIPDGIQEPEVLDESQNKPTLLSVGKTQRLFDM